MYQFKYFFCTIFFTLTLLGNGSLKHYLKEEYNVNLYSFTYSHHQKQATVEPMKEYVKNFLVSKKEASSSFTIANVASAVGHFLRFVLERPSTLNKEPNANSSEFGPFMVWKMVVLDSLNVVKVTMKGAFKQRLEAAVVSKNVDLQINEAQRKEFEEAVRRIPNHPFFESTVEIAKKVDLSSPSVLQISPEDYDRCLEVLGIVMLTSGGLRPELLSNLKVTDTKNITQNKDDPGLYTLTSSEFVVSKSGKNRTTLNVSLDQATYLLLLALKAIQPVMKLSNELFFTYSDGSLVNGVRLRGKDAWSQLDLPRQMTWRNVRDIWSTFYAQVCTFTKPVCV